MDRRAFLASVTGGLLAAPLAVEAQQAAERIRQIGVLGHGTGYAFSEFEGELQARGWIKGRNVAVEYRYSGGRPERLVGLATELVQLRPDVIVAHTNPAILAAKVATTTIPIVMYIAVDPVASSLVPSLAHPGGNVTGATFDVGDDIWGKRLELLKAAAPQVTRVAVLWNPAYAPNRNRWKSVDEAAQKLGVTLVSVEAQGASDLDRGFALMAKGRVGGLFVLGDPVLFGVRGEIADLALKRHLPTVSPYREGTDAGGLVAYGVSLAGELRHVAQYVDKILRGAKPGDLPVEQPTNFELVINLKTAKALGLTISPSLLARADEVIQ